MTPEQERRVVEEAARRILARERWSPDRLGYGFEGSADQAIEDALPDDADLAAWAELARRAMRRARELRGEKRRSGPPEPKNISGGGVPFYEHRADGSFGPV